MPSAQEAPARATTRTTLTELSAHQRKDRQRDATTARSAPPTAGVGLRASVYVLRATLLKTPRVTFSSAPDSHAGQCTSVSGVWCAFTYHLFHNFSDETTITIMIMAQTITYKHMNAS